MNFLGNCLICNSEVQYTTEDDYWSCRDGLSAKNCPNGGCVTRERALSKVLFELYSRDEVCNMKIYECSPCMRGLSLFLKKNCENYFPTGFFPGEEFGSFINGVRNENLESLTLDSGSIDIWLHLDVLEHLFSPFTALREIYRTLKPEGVCLFTAPTYPGHARSEQVAWQTAEGDLRILGEPEYHGNPQRPEDGALVTWRYGYDLPLLIQRETGFDVEVRRWQSKKCGVMGIMTEVYVCTKNS